MKFTFLLASLICTTVTTHTMFIPTAYSCETPRGVIVINKTEVPLTVYASQILAFSGNAKGIPINSSILQGKPNKIYHSLAEIQPGQRRKMKCMVHAITMNQEGNPESYNVIDNTLTFHLTPNPTLGKIERSLQIPLALSDFRGNIVTASILNGCVNFKHTYE
jgi:hypothetical protein